MIGDLAVYRDRRSGELRRDAIHGERFLAWAYGTRSGWWMTRMLFSRRWVSRLYGCWQSLPWTRRRIRPFAARHGIDLSECARPVASYRSFADFMRRRIDLSRRPIDPRPEVCIAPVDGRVLVLACVGAHDELMVKNSRFCLRELLGDDGLAAGFDGGAVAIFRLHLADYHHFHFPLAGVPSAIHAVPGRYYAVTPYSPRLSLDFYAENRRAVTRIATEAVGELAMVEIGAFTVGSIRQDFQPGCHVAKGEHKGWFELGGSTVVLLFRAGAIEFDADLLRNSAAGMETSVRLGEPVGRVVRVPCSSARDRGAVV